MKIIEINALSTGSTGNIMFGIADVAIQSNIEVYTFSGTRKGFQRKRKNHFYFGSFFSYIFHYYGGLFLGLNDRLSIIGTRKMIKKIKMINPDLIHLHIVHGQYLNIKMLFNFFASINIPIIWTFHDCWAFTGRCPHFVLANCDKWISGCKKCKYPKMNYPASLIDNSKSNWNIKRNLFLSLKKLTIVVPSEWMKGIVQRSFLKDKPVYVINNGIDLSTFCLQRSFFREKNNIEKKYIILGVANIWNKRKGIDVFHKLADDITLSSYQIILVGDYSSVNEKKGNIIYYGSTSSKKELVDIYNAANVFVNPTREDTFPTVNMEALACGIPVVTFETGGSPEIINETCGCVVKCDDIDSLKNNIIKICDNNIFSKEACIERAKSFNMIEKFNEYINIYKDICEKSK